MEKPMEYCRVSLYKASNNETQKITTYQSQDSGTRVTTYQNNCTPNVTVSTSTTTSGGLSATSWEHGDFPLSQDSSSLNNWMSDENNSMKRFDEINNRQFGNIVEVNTSSDSPSIRRKNDSPGLPLIIPKLIPNNTVHNNPKKNIPSSHQINGAVLQKLERRRFSDTGCEVLSNCNLLTQKYSASDSGRSRLYLTTTQNNNNNNNNEIVIRQNHRVGSRIVSENSIPVSYNVGNSLTNASEFSETSLNKISRNYYKHSGYSNYNPLSISSNQVNQSHLKGTVPSSSTMPLVSHHYIINGNMKNSSYSTNNSAFQYSGSSLNTRRLSFTGENKSESNISVSSDCWIPITNRTLFGTGGIINQYYNEKQFSFDLPSEFRNAPLHIQISYHMRTRHGGQEKVVNNTWCYVGSEYQTCENERYRVLGSGAYGQVLRIRRSRCFHRINENNQDIKRFEFKQQCVKIIDINHFVCRGLKDQLAREVYYHQFCNHLNIVKVHKVLTTAEKVFVIMELMDYGPITACEPTKLQLLYAQIMFDMQKSLQNSGKKDNIERPYIFKERLINRFTGQALFDEDVVRVIIYQLLLGLKYLHSFSCSRLKEISTFDKHTECHSGISTSNNQVDGIIHRDVKPANILVNSKGIIKLADFGWCAAAYDTSSHGVAGTFVYMPPEVITPDAEETAKTISIALGIDARHYVASIHQKPGSLKTPQTVCQTTKQSQDSVYKSYQTQTDKVDLWGLGTCMYELLCGEPLFVNTNPPPGVQHNEWSLFEMNFFHSPSYISSRMKYLITAPYLKSLYNDKTSKFSDEAIDFLQKLLSVNEEERLSAAQALEEPWIASASRYIDEWIKTSTGTPAGIVEVIEQ